MTDSTPRLRVVPESDEVQDLDSLLYAEELERRPIDTLDLDELGALIREYTRLAKQQVSQH